MPASVADAARAAMTDGVVLGGCVAAGFVLLGLIASFLIPSAPAGEAGGSGPSPEPEAEAEAEAEAALRR
ncbi:hypothetical protein ACIQVA_27410 [Streptomyces microflavus]|uniref:hypothetical protein n=1 Tax=Streptomyces microflavus TaxID=1919 RepID=UPI0037FF6368